MKIKKQLFIFVLILLVAFAVRIYKLSEVPVGFFADEASIGYNSFLILTSGTDEYGKPYPFFFEAFGEYKNPVQTYSTVPFIALFGLNEFSVRLTSVFYGVLGILAIFLLTKQLFPLYPHSTSLSLLAALFLAISPWHIHFSRVSLEGLTAFVFFTTLASFLFLKALEKPKYLFLSTVSFVLAFYSYFPARIFIPLFVTTLILLFGRSLLSHRKIVGMNIVLGFILLIPLLTLMISPEGWARWNQVNIFSHPPKEKTIFEHIGYNYYTNLSFDFLFLKGDIDMPGRFITRHSVRGIGELYLLQLPLIFLGLFFLFRFYHKHAIAMLLPWILLYPTGSMFTLDQSVQATRSIIGVVPWQIISACGVLYLIYIFKNKIIRFTLLTGVSIFIVLAFSNYIYLYFSQYPQYSSDYWGWQYGPKKVMEYFLQQKDNYDELYLSDEFNAPYIFLRFYDPYNQCVNKCKILSLQEGNLVIDLSKRQLFALTPSFLQNKEYTNIFEVIHTVYYPNNEPAFYIGRITLQQ